MKTSNIPKATAAAAARQTKPARQEALLKPRARANAAGLPIKAKRAVVDRSSTPRQGSKISAVVGLLRAKSGATIDQLIKTTGWQAHSVRGVISGMLKKKLGLTIASERVNGVRRYRIVK